MCIVLSQSGQVARCRTSGASGGVPAKECLCTKHLVKQGVGLRRERCIYHRSTQTSHTGVDTVPAQNVTCRMVLSAEAWLPHSLAAGFFTDAGRWREPPTGAGDSWWHDSGTVSATVFWVACRSWGRQDACVLTTTAEVPCTGDSRPQQVQGGQRIYTNPMPASSGGPESGCCSSLSRSA